MPSYLACWDTIARGEKGKPKLGASQDNKQGKGKKMPEAAGHNWELGWTRSAKK